MASFVIRNKTKRQLWLKKEVINPIKCLIVTVTISYHVTHLIYLKVKEQDFAHAEFGFESFEFFEFSAVFWTRMNSNLPVWNLIEQVRPNQFLSYFRFE